MYNFLCQTKIILNNITIKLTFPNSFNRHVMSEATEEERTFDEIDMIIFAGINTYAQSYIHYKVGSSVMFRTHSKDRTSTIFKNSCCEIVVGEHTREYGSIQLFMTYTPYPTLPTYENSENDKEMKLAFIIEYKQKRSREKDIDCPLPQIIIRKGEDRNGNWYAVNNISDMNVVYWPWLKQSNDSGNYEYVKDEFAVIRMKIDSFVKLNDANVEDEDDD